VLLTTFMMTAIFSTPGRKNQPGQFLTSTDGLPPISQYWLDGRHGPNIEAVSEAPPPPMTGPGCVS
jgi:hypothetical protein